jgi:hypothetical protein
MAGREGVSISILMPARKLSMAAININKDK